MKTWKIDPTHSNIAFKVKHLMISTVKGEFGAFDATMQTNGDEGFENAKVEFSAQIASISTGNEQRDNHLKSADFFDAENHPELQFTSTAFKRVDDENYQLEGILRIRGVEKPVTLDVEYSGNMVDFYGNNKVGFGLRGKINRHDFGLAWNAVTEAGGVVVSEDVRLELDVQMAQQN
ncbi:MAG: YceI family protein [Haliscomenobacter sp.]|nr:YceI family protein [Haliscomenobacter sp.]